MLLENSDGRDLAGRELKTCDDNDDCRGRKICVQGKCTRDPDIAKSDKGKRRSSCYLVDVAEVVCLFLYILTSL